MMQCKIDHEADGAIPYFLCARCNPEPKTNRGMLRIVAPPIIDPITKRQQELRAVWAAQRKAKQKAALAQYLEKHAGERWAKPKGSKTKMWIRDEKSLSAHHAKLEAEFEAELAAAQSEAAAA